MCHLDNISSTRLYNNYSTSQLHTVTGSDSGFWLCFAWSLVTSSLSLHLHVALGFRCTLFCFKQEISEWVKERKTEWAKSKKKKWTKHRTTFKWNVNLFWNQLPLVAIKVFKCFVVLVQTEIKVGFSKHVSYRFTGNILKQKCKHRNLKWGANGGKKTILQTSKSWFKGF